MAAPKHIELKYHKVRECVRDKLISFTHVQGSDNIADVFTKACPRISFQRQRDRLVKPVHTD